VSCLLLFHGTLAYVQVKEGVSTTGDERHHREAGCAEPLWKSSCP
jgi:hypothetical protein